MFRDLDRINYLQIVETLGGRVDQRAGRGRGRRPQLPRVQARRRRQLAHRHLKAAT